jgi:hypothetical protein
MFINTAENTVTNDVNTRPASMALRVMIFFVDRYHRNNIALTVVVNTENPMDVYRSIDLMLTVARIAVINNHILAPSSIMNNMTKIMNLNLLASLK